MEKMLFSIIAFFAVFSCSYAEINVKGDKNMKYIFPNPNETIILVKATETTKETMSGEMMSASNPLYKKIMEELNSDYHQSVIKLFQCSRNLASDKNGPNVLFLSENEGGFPRKGISIKIDDTIYAYPGLNYVDLVVDEKGLNQGCLNIYSHELGHTMMMNIFKNYPDKISRKQHVSMGITDYFTAFSEGWGEHFQRFAYDNVKKYQDSWKNIYEGGIGKSFWHCNIDEDLRINGVVKNDYIYKKLLPEVDKSSLKLDDLIILEHISPVFNKTKLKNSQEMLSCEGVIATLFYKINSNAVIQNNYMPKEFYKPFLIKEMPKDLDVKDLFTPFENAILKNIWVWNRIKDNITRDSVIFMDFIKEWCNSFPEDKKEILRIFITTTAGKTINNEIASLHELASYYGMMGDYAKYKELLGKYKELSNSIIEKAEKGEVQIDANIGKELWIENSGFLLPIYLWVKEYKEPLMVNINTASKYELASFPKMNIEKAEKVIKERTKREYFKSIEEAKSCGLEL